MIQESTDKIFCTTREASDMLGVSVGTVRQWIERDLLRAWKTDGGHRRIRRDSVERLLFKKLPLRRASDLEQTVPESSADKPRHLRLLLVERDPFLLHHYQQKIAAWPLPVDVHAADGPVAALLRMGRRMPDLLVADLQTLDAHGPGLLPALCTAPEAADMAVVVFSERRKKDAARHALLPKGVGFLPRPLPFDQLYAMAFAIAGDKRLERRAQPH
jgi:excisionase family DNA binding protein